MLLTSVVFLISCLVPQPHTRPVCEEHLGCSPDAWGARSVVVPNQGGKGAPLHSGLLMCLSHYWAGSHKGPTLAAKPNKGPLQHADLNSLSRHSVNGSLLPWLISHILLHPLGLGWAGEPNSVCVCVCVSMCVHMCMKGKILAC